MSDLKIDACFELNDYAEEFIESGVTDNVASNLRDNKGLAGGSEHTDCTDLNDVNDCYTGTIPSEVDSYDDCSWKQWVKDTFGKLYELFKGIIASICGLWNKISQLEERISLIMKALMGGEVKEIPVTLMVNFLKEKENTTAEEHKHVMHMKIDKFKDEDFLDVFKYSLNVSFGKLLFVQDCSVNTRLGTVYKTNWDAALGSYKSDKTDAIWGSIAKYGLQWTVYQSNGISIGFTFYGPNHSATDTQLAMVVGSIVGGDVVRHSDEEYAGVSTPWVEFN